MKTGWIKLYRSILDNDIWTSKEPFDKRSAWIDLLLMAEYGKKTICIGYQEINVKPGQIFITMKDLQSRWKWGEKKIRQFIGYLKGNAMVTTKGTTKGTLLTIEKWEDFQCEGQTKGRTKDASKGRTKGVMKDVSKGEPSYYIRNIKNNKNIKKGGVDFYPDDEALADAFNDYIEMRNAIKSPMTERAKELAVKKLDGLSGGNNDVKIEILNQSVINSWKGLFELNTSKPKEKPHKSYENGDGTIDWGKV